MRNIIYHYYFNIYDPKKDPEIFVKKEEYEPCSSKKEQSYFLYSRERRIIYDKDINTVVLGKYILMTERDDEKALKMFKEYLNDKIKEKEQEIERYHNTSALIDSLNLYEKIDGDDK